MKQLQEIDAKVKDELGAEAKDQDKALADKLAARRRKREAAIEKERSMKSNQLQERINHALGNSDDYQVVRTKMGQKALEEVIRQMKLELTNEEIPGAIERLIDEKHQKELEDLLLKLYEQKTVELKEEILAMMEEKLAKQ